MSAAKKGKPAAWTKGHISEDIREKLRVHARSRKGEKHFGPRRDQLIKYTKLANAARRRSVIELTTGKIYKSVGEAVDAHSITSVSYLCRTGNASRFGLRFRYVTDVE